MRRGQVGIGSIIALSLTALLGGMMLIPAPEADSRVTQASPLATASSLSRFLNDAIDRPEANSLSAAPVTEVASLAEPVPAVPVVTPKLSVSPAPVAPVAAATPKPSTPAPIATPTSAALPSEPTPTPALVDPAILAKAERIAVRTPVNLRTGPSTDQSSVMVLPAREEVAVLERSGSWARIARADGTTGWVYASYLGEDRTPAASAAPATRDAAATPRPANDEGPQLASLKLRAEPSTRARSITVLEPGTPLKVAERRPGWVRVIMPDGITGWVRTTN